MKLEADWLAQLCALSLFEIELDRMSKELHVEWKNENCPHWSINPFTDTCRDCGLSSHDIVSGTHYQFIGDGVVAAMDPIDPHGKEKHKDHLKNMAHTDEGIDGPADKLPHWKRGDTKDWGSYQIWCLSSRSNLLDMYNIVEASAEEGWVKIERMHGDPPELVDKVTIEIRRKR